MGRKVPDATRQVNEHAAAEALASFLRVYALPLFFESYLNGAAACSGGILDSNDSDSELIYTFHISGLRHNS